MINSFYDAIKERRTYYGISNERVVSDDRIEEVIAHAVKHTPSAFNSQTARVVILLNKHHNQLWDITMEALKEIVPEEKFGPTEAKINAFKAGYGTVLFFEDHNTVEYLQKEFPTYKKNFPIWSKESSGMLQFNIWTSLALEGYGASLQHYNELIIEKVRKEWNIPDGWEMRAQMPFGKSTSQPTEKEFNPIENRLKFYK